MIDPIKVQRGIQFEHLNVSYLPHYLHKLHAVK